MEAHVLKHGFIDVEYRTANPFRCALMEVPLVLWNLGTTNLESVPRAIGMGLTQLRTFLNPWWWPLFLTFVPDLRSFCRSGPQQLISGLLPAREHWMAAVAEHLSRNHVVRDHHDEIEVIYKVFERIADDLLMLQSDVAVHVPGTYSQLHHRVAQWFVDRKDQLTDISGRMWTLHHKAHPERYNKAMLVALGMDSEVKVSTAKAQAHKRTRTSVEDDSSDSDATGYNPPAKWCETCKQAKNRKQAKRCIRKKHKVVKYEASKHKD